ncbi:hypothetical protein L3Q82_006440 [Scortum barcoo]|uniref:Uncharacterized protein n=1 Tax=Scortum barcoo TaxID=214431 RepID=A0ACB8X087_9TELE|nr:hypothetical protein L3Q82_006440 [Scortum barcoo]
MELHTEKRFHNLTHEQIQALDKVRAKDIIRVVKDRLVERDIQVKDIRLNGATASHVLVRDNGLGYRDLDIIFGVELPRQEDLQEAYVQKMIILDHNEDKNKEQEQSSVPLDVEADIEKDSAMAASGESQCRDESASVLEEELPCVEAEHVDGGCEAQKVLEPEHINIQQQEEEGVEDVHSEEDIVFELYVRDPLMTRECLKLQSDEELSVPQASQPATGMNAEMSAPQEKVHCGEMAEFKLFPPIEIPKPLQPKPPLQDSAQVHSSSVPASKPETLETLTVPTYSPASTLQDEAGSNETVGQTVKPKHSKKPPDSDTQSLKPCTANVAPQPQISEQTPGQADTVPKSCRASPWAGAAEEPAITVEAECMYGDFEQAMDHLHHRLIATHNPEEIRGGGLLKYSDLLVRNFRPASETEIKSLERYMCSRFFIDFPDVGEQQRKIEAYLQCHFIGNEEASKYDYLMTLRRVINESTVCLMGHERRQTLNMITVLALRVLGEQNAMPSPTRPTSPVSISRRRTWPSRFTAATSSRRPSPRSSTTPTLYMSTCRLAWCSYSDMPTGRHVTGQTKSGSQAHHEQKNIKDRYVARIGVTGAPPWSQAWGWGYSQASAWWPGLCPHGTRPGSARNGWRRGPAFQ